MRVKSFTLIKGKEAAEDTSITLNFLFPKQRTAVMRNTGMALAQNHQFQQ